MRNFHGARKTSRYFEGWYIKHQNKGRTIAFIPAFHVNETGKKSASLQVVTDTEAYYFEYPASEFEAFEQSFFVRLGKSSFSRAGCHIDIHEPELTIQGDILYGPFQEIRGDIMGPFAYLPYMQCSHGIVSMGHTLSGGLFVNGTIVDFSGGAGYIETDRGRSFPKEYLWTQCNIFGGEDVSIMASCADIPIGKKAFRGCICSVRHHGTEYRLATYRGVNIDLYAPKSLILSQGSHQLRISLLEEHPLTLRCPVSGAMDGRIRESAACKVRYEFLEHGTALFDLTSDRASFEFVGADTK